MKLKDLLNVTGLDTPIIVLLPDDTLDEPTFKGFVSDVPWTIVDYELYPGITDDLDCLDVMNDENGRAEMLVSVKESNE